MHELNKAYEQRGESTKAQVEYARSEIRALEELYPLQKVSEEIRRPHLRTLKSYLSINAMSFEGS